jgi:DNA-binding NarL/FixJ family response regulator
MVCNLLLVDDHPVFRESLKMLLRPHADLRVVGEASDAAEACELAASTGADVVLLDVKLRGSDGMDVLRELRRRDSRSRVLMVTMVDDAARAAEAFEAGALGYATKDEPFESVVTAIRAVHAGRRYLSPVLSRADVDEWVRTQSAGDPLAALTTREREVFDLAVQGLTSAQIGDQLAVSRRTVESHRSRILMKLHARSALDLVRIAARCGVLKDGKN